MLTVQEVTERLRLSRAEVYKLIKLGKIAHYRIGRRVLIGEDDLKAYLESCRVTSATGSEMALRHFRRSGQGVPSPDGLPRGADRKRAKHSGAGAHPDVRGELC